MDISSAAPSYYQLSPQAAAKTPAPGKEDGLSEKEAPADNKAPNNHTNKSQASDSQEQKQILDEVRRLAQRDREVRSHEAAHAAVGGSYAGSPSYEFKRGPDGKQYAVSGEVSIDVGKASNPEATIDKMQQVKAAALAPAQPSAADRSVAATALRIESEARLELLLANRAEQEQPTNASSGTEPKDSETDGTETGSSDTDNSTNVRAKRLFSVIASQSLESTQDSYEQQIDVIS